MTDWRHGDLADDLALARRGVGEAVVTELNLRSRGTGGYVDVATLKLSWASPVTTGYEIKVSRADFLRDVQTAKFERYLPYFRRFYFACPAGLISKEEVPEGCGLMVRGEERWSGVKAPRLREVTPEIDAHLRLAMIMGCHPGPWNRRKESRAARIQRFEFTTWRQLQYRGMRLGRRVVEALRDADDEVHDLKARLEAKGGNGAVPAGKLEGLAQHLDWARDNMAHVHRELTALVENAREEEGTSAAEEGQGAQGEGPTA